jgi:hypothetical protein
MSTPLSIRISTYGNDIDEIRAQQPFLSMEAIGKSSTYKKSACDKSTASSAGIAVGWLIAFNAIARLGIYDSQRIRTISIAKKFKQHKSTMFYRSKSARMSARRQ